MENSPDYEDEPLTPLNDGAMEIVGKDGDEVLDRLNNCNRLLHNELKSRNIYTADPQKQAEIGTAIDKAALPEPLVVFKLSDGAMVYVFDREESPRIDRFLSQHPYHSFYEPL